MPALLPPPDPPAILAPAGDSVLERFLAERITPASDPELREVLRRTWVGSKSFREVLTALFREQPKVRLTFKKIDSTSFGGLVLSKDPDIYPLELRVQWRGVRRGLDLAEPWLASITFALLEVSRAEGVIPSGAGHYGFAHFVQTRMWDFQGNVRKELRAFDSTRYRKLAPDGGYLWLQVFPREIRSGSGRIED